MTIFITGVSSGIGWGLTQYFLNQGHVVFGISRRVPSDFQNIENFHHLSLDLSDFEKCSDEIKQFLQPVKTIDLAILNAGILGRIDDLKNQNLEEIKTVMDINVWSNKVIIDAILESASVEKVVAISSGAAVNGNRGWGGYSLSKATLNMLIQLYASENDKTSFYALAPGLVDTAMQDYLCSGELNIDTFPAAQKLIDARNTENMPGPEKAADMLVKAMDKLDEFPSGSFKDIRKM